MAVSTPTRTQIAAIASVTSLVLIVAYWTTMASFHYSSTTTFCTSCHEMVQPYERYKLSRHFANEHGVVADCADCHLPPGGFNKWYAKVSQGATDSIMHFLLDPEDVDHEKWKASAVRNIRSESCLTCHKNLTPPELSKGGLLAHRSFSRGEVAGSCLQCHQNLVH